MCDSFIISYLTSKEASQIARGISIIEGKLSESNQFQPEDAVQIFPLLIPLLMHIHYKVRKNAFYLFLSILNRFSDYLDSTCDSVPNCIASLICVDEEIAECAHQALEFIFDLEDPKYWWPYCDKVFFNSKSNPQRIKLMYIIYSHFDEIPVLPIIKLLDDPIFTIQKMAYSMLQFNDQEAIQTKLEKYRTLLGMDTNPYELDLNQKQLERYIQFQESMKAQKSEKKPAKVVRRTRRARASDNLLETRRQAAEEAIQDEMYMQGEKSIQSANDHKVHSRFVSKMENSSPIGKRPKGSYTSYDNYQLSPNLTLNPQFNLDPNPNLDQTPNFNNQNDMNNQDFMYEDYYDPNQQNFNNNSSNRNNNQQYQSYNQSPNKNRYENGNYNNFDNSNARSRNSVSPNNQNRSSQQMGRPNASPGPSRGQNYSSPANDNQDRRYPVPVPMNSQQRGSNNNNYGNNSNNSLFNRSNNNNNQQFNRSANNSVLSNRSNSNANNNNNYDGNSYNNGLFTRAGNNNANNNSNNQNSNSLFNRSYNKNSNNDGLSNRSNNNFSNSLNNMNSRYNDNQNNRNGNMNNRFMDNQNNRSNMNSRNSDNQSRSNNMNNRFNDNQSNRSNSINMNNRFGDNQSNRSNNMNNRFMDNQNNRGQNMMNNRFNDPNNRNNSNMNSMGNRYNDNQNLRNSNMNNMNSRFNNNQNNNMSNGYNDNQNFRGSNSNMNGGYNDNQSNRSNSTNNRFNDNQNYRNNNNNNNNYDYYGDQGMDGGFDANDNMFDQMYPMNQNSAAIFDKDSMYEGILQQLGNSINTNDSSNLRTRRGSSDPSQTLGNGSPSKSGEPLPIELVDLKDKNWEYRKDYLEKIHKTLSSKKKHYDYRHDYLMDCVMDAAKPPNKRVAIALSKVITDVILEEPGVIEPFLDEITNFMVQSVSSFNSIYQVPSPSKTTKSSNNSAMSSSMNTPRASSKSSTQNTPKKTTTKSSTKGGENLKNDEDQVTPTSKKKKGSKISTKETDTPKNDDENQDETSSKVSTTSKSATPSKSSKVFNIPTSPSKTARVVLVSKTPNSAKSTTSSSKKNRSKTSQTHSKSPSVASDRSETVYDVSAFDELIDAIILEVNPAKLINSMLDYPNRTTAHVELLIQKLYRRRPNLTLCMNDLEKLLTFLTLDAYPLALKLGTIGGVKSQPAYLDAVIFILHKTAKNQPKIYSSIISLQNHAGMVEILLKFLPKQEQEEQQQLGNSQTLKKNNTFKGDTQNYNYNYNSRNIESNEFDIDSPPMFIVLRELKKNDDCSIDVLADNLDNVAFNSPKHLLKVFLRFLALLSRLSENKIKDNENELRRICVNNFNSADLLSILSLRNVEPEILIGLSKYIWFAPKDIFNGADSYYENMYKLFTKSTGQARSAIIMTASGIQKATKKSILDLPNIAEPHQKVIEKLLSQFENQDKE